MRHFKYSKPHVKYANVKHESYRVYLKFRNENLKEIPRAACTYEEIKRSNLIKKFKSSSLNLSRIQLGINSMLKIFVQKQVLYRWDDGYTFEIVKDTLLQYFVKGL